MEVTIDKLPLIVSTIILFQLHLLLGMTIMSAFCSGSTSKRKAKLPLSDNGDTPEQHLREMLNRTMGIDKQQQQDNSQS